ncbi:hypothetical protein C0992_001685 [Termitomyces sp. T32_za158]|nr:hypothetical protein C0992_001685 [Termitomyces sp. T32_za158]
MAGLKWVKVFTRSGISTISQYAYLQEYRCCQIAAQELHVPLEAVYTSESSSNTVPSRFTPELNHQVLTLPIKDTVPTAASAGSDLQGHAVHNACIELNRRLEPFRQRLGDNAPLATLAVAAWADRVSLSATGYFKPEGLGYEWG